MKLLLTAFDPFGGEKVNPALEAVKRVSCAKEDIEIVKLEVPTVFGLSVNTVLEAMRIHCPDAVLCVGQAGGRAEVTPERVAINVDDARIPDNNGNQPVDRVIREDGQPAYFATLPVKAMVAAIRAAGIPAALSNTAGTFVCNHLMYGVLYHIAREFPGMRGGFVHVPFIPEQTKGRENLPSLPLEDIVRALEAAIAAIAENGVDVRTAEGKEF